MTLECLVKKSARSLLVAACATLVSTPAFSQLDQQPQQTQQSQQSQQSQQTQQATDEKTMMATMLSGQQEATSRPKITNQRMRLPGQYEQSRQSMQSLQEGANTLQAPLIDRVPGPFELYVSTVTGKELKIFGQDLFRNVPTTFAPLDTAQVNPEYLIGPGDELQIRGWGMVDIDIDVKVDRSGSVNIPRVGNIKVAGIKYRDLQGYLTKAVGRVFNNFELTVSVSQTRAVQIYVVGHALRPGTYTMSAMSTLLNALFNSGGPNAVGSMRRIQLKRGNEIVTTFDLYDMLVNGDKSKDAPLRDGDVIYIPEAGQMVALTGNVKQPAIFEMKGQTSLADVVRWAGGFDASAEGKPVIVEKSVDNAYRTVAEMPADSGALTRLGSVPVGPSDVVRVFAPGAVPVNIHLQHEFVKVSGEVRQGGLFEIRPGETLRELITRLGGPTENGYLFATSVQRDSIRRSQQLRLNEAADRFEHDIEVSASDRLSHATDPSTVASITADLERQRRMAQRLREVKAEGRIVLELANASAGMADLPDLPLQDGDTVKIPRKPGTVDVIGSVFQQNAVLYRPHRTVDDYLALVGGPTANADKSEIYLIRADGSAKSGRTSGWFSGIGGTTVNPGDAIIVPEKINGNTWVQSFKEWTTILYQFGLGAAGLKVLKQ
jgi:protein involved in polysaccharide export with SLBB domain